MPGVEPAASAAPDGARAWTWLLAGCVVLVGAAETLLLELGQGFFSGGFNGVYITGLPRIALFAAAGAVVDAALILGVWCLAVPLLSRVLGRGLQSYTLAALLGLAVPVAFDVVRYKLLAILGDVASWGILWDLAGRDVSNIVSEGVPQLGALALVVPGVVAAAAVLVFAARSIEARVPAARNLPAPTGRRLLAAWGGAAVLGGALVAATLQFAPAIHHGVTSKPGGALLLLLVQQASDVDRDGFGWLSRPPDPAPFDADVHAYALDRPGDGVDQNGLAGDHPADAVAPRSLRPPPATGRRPHLLLLFLESFRGDLIGREHEGRPITPFLARLAAEGAASERAFVHSPFTVGARAQLFGGRVAPFHGQDTLVDDFRERGYTVALFSGQDDSFGESEDLMGAARADLHYDARQDVELRTSRTTQKVSLQVSWKTLLARVEAFLAEHDPDQPLLLYVNVVDSHFPYHHDDLDNLLDVEPSERGEISAQRADRVWATYANAVANVDRACERVTQAFRARLGQRDHALLVTADHGQAIFDAGFLGHGQSLSQDQSRVPLVVWGIGGDWPEPVGIGDLRGLLGRDLFAPRGDDVPRTRFAPDPDRVLLQYMTRLTRPRLLALRGADRATLYDLRRDRLALLGPGDVPRDASDAERATALRELVWRWEALRLVVDDQGQRGGEVP